MASLSGKKVKDTYKGLIKTSDNSAVTSSNVELTDGLGNGIGVQVNTSGNVTASGAVTGNTIVKSGGTALQILLADGTVITLTRESDGIGSNDSDSNIPSNAAVKDYVDTEITNLIASAPSALDTLNELATALGNDANFSTTITTALGNRLRFDASQSLNSTEITQALTNLGITATVAEINYIDGVTSNIQTQLNGLQTAITGGATTVTDSNLTASRALVSNASGKISASDITSTEIGYLDNVSSNIQTQIDGKQATITGAATTIDDANLTASKALISNASGKVAVSSVTDTELGYVSGVTSSIQDQFDNLTDNNTTYTVSAVDSGDDAIIRLTGSDSSTDDVTLEAGSNITLTPSGDTITIASTASGGGGGGLSWQSTLKTANFTATANEGYFVDVSSGSVTVTMPSSPSVGDNVGIVDVKGSSQTNAITITSSNNIQGASADKTLGYERGAVNLVYSGSTDGWVVSSAANESNTALGLTDFTVEYLVVAGGGGSGGITTASSTNYSRGGGGAGGLRTSHASDTSGGGGSTESTLTLSPNTNYTVTVGAGGAAGSKGEDSVFATITSEGGGQLGADGGSGGGADWADTTAGSGTTNQGFAGGSNTSNILNGGGGGAGEAGNTDGAGSGGDGVISTIITSSQATTNSVGEVSGSDVYFAGGGSSGGAAAGLGGGGQSGANNGGDNAGAAGAANTGGGGGAATVDGPGSANGGAGGSGVVIIRYPSAVSVSETTSGGNVLGIVTITEGDEKITIFKSGDGTIKFS